MSNRLYFHLATVGVGSERHRAELQQGGPAGGARQTGRGPGVV